MKKTIFIVIVGIVLLLFIGDRTKIYVQTTPPFIGFGAFENNYVGVDEISYKGKQGKTALMLLKQQAEITEKSGFVTAINGRMADNKKHEYWAFYVNGKLANIGAAEYITKDEDVIMWKIERY